MTDPPPPYPWLPSALVLAWLKVKLVENDPRADLIEQCRQATADWIQDQRKDLFVTVGDGDDAVTTYTPTPRIIQAGLLGAGRLFFRMDSPAGVVSFDELGAGSLLSNDPDMKRMLGRPKLVTG